MKCSALPCISLLAVYGCVAWVTGKDSQASSSPAVNDPWQFKSSERFSQLSYSPFPLLSWPFSRTCHFGISTQQDVSSHESGMCKT